MAAHQSRPGVSISLENPPRQGGPVRSAPSQLAYFRGQASTIIGNSSVVVKFICGALVVGYLISFSPRAVDLLTVLPGKLIPPNFWVWTCVTHSFIEIHWWMVLTDIAVVILYGKLLEPLWGALETLRFYAVVNLSIAVLTAFSYFLAYLATRNTDYLFSSHIHGLAGYLAGFSVAVKQSMSDHVLVSSPFGKLRNRHVPLWVLVAAVGVRVLGGVDAPFPVMFAWGLVVSWVYLRFYQRHGNGTVGDTADNFSFASFFPEMVQPVVAVFSNTVHSMLVQMHICKKQTRRFEASSPVTVAINLPGTDTHDAERRRQLALKALNERLSRAPTTNWPDLEDAEMSPGRTGTATTGAPTGTEIKTTAAAPTDPVADPPAVTPGPTPTQNNSEGSSATTQ